MASSPTRVILAADFGGTKGDLILADADSGRFLRRIVEQADGLPARPGDRATAAGGLGRTPEMGNHCLEKAFQDLAPAEVYVAFTGLCHDPGFFPTRGIHCAAEVLLKEEDGIMAAEDCATGICSILGTGATGRIYREGLPSFTIDAYGPVCGDWGGADYIGRQFARSALREQNFSRELLPEIRAIYDFLRQKATQAPNPPSATGFHLAWAIVAILLRHQERSFIAALAALCDQCARNGSAIARAVLEDAGREAALNIQRGARFTGIDQRDDLPVFVSGSVFLRSDIVYQSFRQHLQAALPNARVRKSPYPQPVGQVIRMLQLIHGPRAARPLVQRFRADAAMHQGAR